MATTQTTAAKLEVQRNDALRAERERDDARSALMADRARELDALAQRTALAAREREERSELATKAWNSLDNADDELPSSKDANAATSVYVEEALKKKGHLKANLKALTCAEVLDWPTFKAQTEQAITALDEAVGKARAQRAPSSIKASSR